MSGSQGAVDGKCPEGFVHVFGPLCVEQTTLAKIGDAVPDLPDFDFSNPGCEAALAALKDVTDMVEKTLEMPRKLMKIGQGLIERPFNTAADAVNKALGIFDNISSLIDGFVSGPAGLVNDLKRSLEAMLACPFIADTPIAKTAASLLDALDGNLPYDAILQELKNRLSSAAKEYLDKVKNMPLSALGELEKLFNDMIERSNIGDLIKKAKDLEQCLRAACNMAEVATRIPTAAETLIEEIGGKWDGATGKFTAVFVNPVTESGKAAKKIADDIAIIRLAGKS